MSHGPALIPILVILLLAAFWRLYRLPVLPPGLNFDEAGTGVAALDILAGRPQLWWRIGGGQEPLWPYIVALSTLTLTPTPLALRLPAAFIGILTIAAVYPLMLALFRNRQPYWMALLTMLGLTFSEWHLHFSRLGFRAILIPWLTACAFYFLWLGLTRTGRRLHVLLAASFMALAVYSYLAARLLPFVVILFIILQGLHYLLRQTPGSIGQLTRPGIYFFLYLALLLLPLGLYFAFYPADLIARATTVSIFNPAWNRGDLVGAAWQTILLTLTTFLGLDGDANPLVNLPHQPALPLFLALFFILGLVVSVYELFRPLNWAGWFGLAQPRAANPAQAKLDHLKPGPPLSPHLFLLCWWSVLLLPAILAPEGAPHHLRLIVALVPTYAFVAIGMTTVINRAVGLLNKQRTPGNRLHPKPSLVQVGAYLLPVACYALLAVQSYLNYFIRWPDRVDFTLPFDLYAVRLAQEIGRSPANVVTILPMDIRAGSEARHYTLDYLLRFSKPALWPPGGATSPPDPASTPYVYIPVDEHNAAALLNQAVRGKEVARVVRWTEDKHHEADAKEIVTFLLETTAQRVGQESFPVYNLETYALASPQTADCSAQAQENDKKEDCNPPPLAFALPAINQQLGLTFGDLLRLEAAFVPPTASPGSWLPVALTLVPLAPMDTDYKASIRLIGPAGERLAQKDRVLQHNFHQGTSLWPPETVNEYYLLPIPPAAPPGDYTIVVVIYHPETLAPLMADGFVEAPVGRVRLR
jgi:hypothetical protein